jgi:hypothetical protein
MTARVIPARSGGPHAPASADGIAEQSGSPRSHPVGGPAAATFRGRIEHSNRLRSHVAPRPDARDLEA